MSLQVPRPPLLVALLLAAVLLVSACKEDSGSGSSASTPTAAASGPTPIVPAATPPVGATGPTSASGTPAAGNQLERAVSAAERFFNGKRINTPDDCKPPLTICLLVPQTPGNGERGLARLSYMTTTDGGALVYMGRKQNGDWDYWFGAQNAVYMQLELPAAVRVCADGEGANVRQQPDGSSVSLGTVKDNTNVSAEEFVLTQPGTLNPLSLGIGWYRVTSPIAGYVRSDLVSSLQFPDCTVRNQFVKPR